MEPNIVYLCYLLETHQALELHAMKHYLAPQTESRLDTFPLDAPDALETPDASCVSISHIVLLRWDIPVNPGYIWSRSDPENQSLPVHRLYGISSLCQDTNICRFHQRKTDDHDVWESESLVDLTLVNLPVESTVCPVVSTACQVESTVCLEQSILLYGIQMHEIQRHQALCNPIGATVRRGQSTLLLHWSIVPLVQILHRLYVGSLDHIIWIIRTHSQLATSCPYLCSFKGVVDADNTHLYLMVFLKIHRQAFQCPLT